MLKQFSRTLAMAAAIGTLGLISANASAATISDVDLFDGTETVAVSSSFNAFFAGNEARLLDGQSDSYVWQDNDTEQRVSISGFNSSIDSLRFFDAPSYTDRLGQDVAVYYSASSISSLTPGDYTSLGTYILSADPHYYGTATSPVDNPTAGEPAVNTGATISFVEISGLGIPAGTQSILLRFSPSSHRGIGLSEVQAFAVPEPSAMIMLMLGTATLAIRCRQK